MGGTGRDSRALTGTWFLTTPWRISLFLLELTTSPFPFLVYLLFSLFFCLFYPPVSLLKTSLHEDEQEN